MRIPPWALLVGGLLAIAVLIGVAVVAAGSDDDDPPSSADTPRSTATAGDQWGPDPVMTEHILAIAPEHKGQIKRGATIERPDRSTGICFDVSYKDLPQNNLMFQMAMDGAIVTTDLTIELTKGTDIDPEEGRLCYATRDGLAPGIHDAAVAVQDPNNLSGPPDELVAWKFEVIE